MWSCCGCSPRKKRPDEEEALLVEYDDDTVLQRRVHEKLHTYQMLRALSTGYMPSNEQVIANLRTLLASDVLNPDETELSDSGRRLAQACKQWFKDFMHLLQDKNAEDQVQDLLWSISKARVSVNTTDVSRRVSNNRAKADATAAYASIQTIGSLLLTNSDFRIFLDDLHTMGRQVFADTAASLSNTADQAAKTLEPSDDDKKALEGPGADQEPAPSAGDLAAKVDDVNQIIGDGVKTTAEEGVASLKEQISPDAKKTIISRLKTAVGKLRQRPDYNDSVSTIALLLRRYAEAYSRAADRTINAVHEDVHKSDDVDDAARNFWSLLRSFGEEKEWNALEEKMSKVMEHSQSDPDFEGFMADLSDSIEKLLYDPDFLDAADEKIQELQEKSKKAGSESSLRQDIDAALIQSRKTLKSVLNDADVHSLSDTTSKIFTILSPPSTTALNPELTHDFLNTFLPLLISAIQHIPIPRLELSTPDIDLLLENLILEPGATVNRTSFLPHRLHLATRTDLDVRVAATRTVSSTTTLLTLTVSGLCLRADAFGFWARLHSGWLLHLEASGLASARADGAGVELELDVEFHPAGRDTVLALRAARVRAPTLDYTLHAARDASRALPWLAALTKPLVRPLLRRTVERALADAVAEACRFANRELVFARERLRATRVADPQDLWTFLRAVAARWVPEPDPDVYTGVGVYPSSGVFRGRYAPGSVVRLWEEEGRRAGERVDDEARRGWRNGVFDVGGVSAGLV